MCPRESTAFAGKILTVAGTIRCWFLHYLYYYYCFRVLIFLIYCFCWYFSRFFGFCVLIFIRFFFFFLFPCLLFCFQFFFCVLMFPIFRVLIFLFIFFVVSSSFPFLNLFRFIIIIIIFLLFFPIFCLCVLIFCFFNIFSDLHSSHFLFFVCDHIPIFLLSQSRKLLTSRHSAANPTSQVSVSLASSSCQGSHKTPNRDTLPPCLSIMGPLKKIARHASSSSSSSTWLSSSSASPSSSLLSWPVAQTIMQLVCLCRLTPFIITFGVDAHAIDVWLITLLLGLLAGVNLWPSHNGGRRKLAFAETADKVQTHLSFHMQV